ncbi:MAG: hypothetical protein DRJ66_03375 [Thermoprotei archaeon]|nr:MAG: hypothetical protein DRJ66_03375 [Thermoprotei archaeon]RLF19826.1 MAG: hypothetical protein DRZ82_04330 [Thermoprotei archaeon]
METKSPRELLLATFLLILVLVIYVRPYLASFLVSYSIVKDMLKTFSHFYQLNVVVGLIVMSLFFTTVLVLYRRLNNPFNGTIKVGDFWLALPNKVIGCITLRGELLIENDKAIASLENRLESFFQALRNSGVTYTLFVSDYEKNDAYKTILGIVVICNNLDELRENLYKVKAGIEATLPELEAVMLSGREILKIIRYSLIPLILDSKKLHINTSKSVLKHLTTACLRGMKRTSYKGLEVWYLPNKMDRSNHNNRIYLGQVIADNKEIAPFYISLHDISSHIAIFGTTGSGKTTTAKTITLRLLKKGIGVLVLDWHNEYSDLLDVTEGTIYRLGLDDVSINPLMHSSGYSLPEHIDFVTDLISDIFNLSHPQAYMLREALKKAYIKAKLQGKVPTIVDLVNEIEKLPIKSGWDHEVKTALLRRLKLLTEGPIGKALNGRHVIKVEDLLTQGLVIIELGHIRNVYAKQLLVFSILKMIYDYYVGRREIVNKVRHVTVIEEALNATSIKTEGLHIIERMLSELRKYGESLIIISQSPTDIPSGVLKNTSVKIVHALREGRDVMTIINSLGLDKKYVEIFHALNTGDAILYAPSLIRPVLLRVKPELFEKLVSQGNTSKNAPDLLVIEVP